jgi:hypothetical protein
LGTVVLPPAETSGDIIRINSQDGSGEYLLLENRQRLGFDSYLYEPGLLVWHIDPFTIATSSGGINNNPDRMGVWLRQADGLNELGEQNGGRGDAGDPFPGLTGNTVFHAGSAPSAWTHDESAMGITLLDIAQVGQEMSFRALTRYQTLTLRAQTIQGTPGLISVDGSSKPAIEWEMDSAPFQSHVIEAASGEPVSEGTRWGFQGWTDGGPRVRDFTTQLEDASFTATYGGMEYLMDIRPTSPAGGIPPGTVAFDGGDGTGWVPSGESVTMTAMPRTGFAFEEWTGPLAGFPNPATYTPSGPVEADAVFSVTFSAEGNPGIVSMIGGFQHSLTLTVENANPPVTWGILSGVLPQNVTLSPSGILSGTPLSRGDYPLTLRALDAIGLQAYLPISVAVDDPEIPWSALASVFVNSGPALNADTRVYLDNEGNDNDAYDLGDLRAYVLRNPGLASYEDLRERVEGVVSVGAVEGREPVNPTRREERR